MSEHLPEGCSSFAFYSHSSPWEVRTETPEITSRPSSPLAPRRSLPPSPPSSRTIESEASPSRPRPIWRAASAPCPRGPPRRRHRHQHQHSYAPVFGERSPTSSQTDRQDRRAERRSKMDVTGRDTMTLDGTKMRWDGT